MHTPPVRTTKEKKMKRVYVKYVCVYIVGMIMTRPSSTLKQVNKAVTFPHSLTLGHYASSGHCRALLCAIRIG